MVDVKKPLQDRIADYAEKRKRQGQSYKETANELGISTSTLYRYRKDDIQTNPSSKTKEYVTRGGRLTQKEDYARRKEVERSRKVASKVQLDIEDGRQAIDLNEYILQMPGRTTDIRDLGSSIRSEEEWVRGLVEEMEEGRSVQVVLYKYKTRTGAEVVTTEKSPQTGELEEERAFRFIPEDLEEFEPKNLADAIFEQIMDWADISP
jgi:transcriptional regulator with XRE-family HTH domain